MLQCLLKKETIIEQSGKQRLLAFRVRMLERLLEIKAPRAAILKQQKLINDIFR